MKKIFIFLLVFKMFVFASSSDFETFFKKNSNKMLLIDPLDGSIIRANEKSSEFYGYSITELENMKIHEINTFTKEQVKKEMTLSKSENRNYFIFRHKLKNGKIEHVEVFTSPIVYNNKKLLFSTIQALLHDPINKNLLDHYSKNLENQVDLEKEVSVVKEEYFRNILIIAFIFQFFVIAYLIRIIREKNSAEKERQKVNKDLSDTYRLFDIGKITAFKWKNDKTWSVDYVSNNISNLLGYSQDEFINDEVLFFNIIYEDDRNTVLEEIANNLVSKAEEVSHKPYRIVTKSGQIKWVLDYTIIIRDKNNVITHFMGYILDITDLKNKETELFDIKNRFQLAIDGANDGLWDWDINTNEVYFSSRWKSMIGYKVDEISNNLNEWSSRIHPSDIIKSLEDVNKHLEGQTEVYVNEHRMRHKDGSWIWVLDRGKVHRNSEGKPLRMVGFHTDITQKKQYEEELHKLVEEKTNQNIKHFELLQQKSKHAAMGEMIGSIAHQWRQPLNTLALRIQFLEDDFNDSLVDQKYLKEFEKNSMNLVNYMSKTIDDFRLFFSIDKSKIVFDVKSVIDETLDMVQSEMEHKNILLKLEGETFYISSYKNEFQQVILNIVSNAKDAIIDNQIINGEISIDIKKENEKAGVISIKDNAGGISNNIKDRIFEPYFTTKEESKGTGIGLYMSKLIIEDNMNGKIYLNKTEETEFLIKLDF